MSKLSGIKIEDALNIQTTEYINSELKPVLDIRVQIDKEKLHDFKTIYEAYLKSLGESEYSYNQEDLHGVLISEILDKLYEKLKFMVFKNETI